MPDRIRHFRDHTNSAYRVECPQFVGESQIGELARATDREYLWIFDSSTNMWRHIRANHSEDVAYDTTGNLVRSSMSLQIPRQVFEAGSRSQSIYHTHPDIAGMTDDLVVKSQLPSTKDIVATIDTGIYGYRDFRIVTSIGVTTLTATETVRRTGEANIISFSLENRLIQKWIGKQGVKRASQKALDYMNDHIGHSVEVNFRPFAD